MKTVQLKHLKPIITLVRTGLLVLFLFAGLKGTAQTPRLWDCTGDNCTAEDIVVDSVFLADNVTGERLSDLFNCNTGEISTVDLLVKFAGNTGAPRYHLVIYFDIFINGTFISHYENCFNPGGGFLPGDEVLIPNADIRWTCGGKMELRDLYMSYWSSSNAECGCNSAKCTRPGAPVAVYSPLIANFTVAKTCQPARLHETVTFTSITSGGMEPYTVVWNLGDPAGYSIVSGSLTSAEVKVNFNRTIDDLSVTLTATDSRAVSPRVDSETKLVDILACCNLQITTPAVNRTVECDGGGNSTEYSGWLTKHGGAVATDLGGGAVTWSDNSATAVWVEDNCDGKNIKHITVTFTASDNCGNSLSTTSTFTIRDITAPAINSSGKANLTVDCDGSADPGGAIAAWLANHAGATATDACSTVSWSHNYAGLSDLCGVTGSALVTFTATDACGNQSSTTALVTIRDITSPAINTTGKANLTVDCDGTADPGGAIAAWLGNHAGATATDACSTVSWGHNYAGLSDLCGVTGSALVIFTATDACGNQSSTTALVTIRDITSPAINTTGKANLTVDCDGTADPAGAIAAWLGNHAGATATDACSMVSWGHNYAGLSDLCGATGSALVTFTATDACGNKSETTATVTIRDITAPAINTSGKANLTVDCDGSADPAGAIAAWLGNHAGATATDACSTVSWGHNYVGLSDLCGATGSALVTFTVTDACGNKSSTTATVTIRDDTAPAINTSGKANLTLDCDGTADPGGAIATWLANHAGATATDACSSVTWDHNYAGLSDLCGATGSVLVTFTATDGCGNQSSTTALVTIRDITPPAINATAKANLTVDCDGTADPAGAIATWLNNHAGATATDACSSVTWDHNYAGLSDLCGATGSVLVTFTATDGCGNQSSTTALVTIRDITPPAINATAKANLTVDCDGTADPGGAIAAWLGNHAGATATDACSIATWGHNYAGLSDLCGATGSAQVTFTATDACGNQSTTTATVTIRDITPPVVSGSLTPVTVEGCDVTALPPAATSVAQLESLSGNLRIIDGCSTDGAITVTHRDVAAGVCPVTVTRTYTLADECGNTTRVNHSLSIEDKTPPEVTVTSHCVFLGHTGQWTLNESDFRLLIAGIQDNCTPDAELILDITPRAFSCNDVNNPTRVKVTARDRCGNAGTGFVELEVKDTISPVALCRDVTIYLDKFDQAYVIQGEATPGDDRESVPEWNRNFLDLEGGSYDNCGIAAMFLSKQLFTSADTGKNNVVLTVYDPSWNHDQCTSIIRVVDTISSVLEPVADVILTVEPGICKTKITYPELKIKGSALVTLEKIAGLGAAGDFPLGTTVETWKATDQLGKVTYTSFSVIVKTRNAPPTLNPVADITVDEDAASFEIPLTGIGYGIDCMAQEIVSLGAENGNESLLTITRTYVNGEPSGKLTVTLKPGLSGEAVVTLTLQDNGGTLNGGHDTTVRSIKITVEPVNDPPEVTPLADRYITLPGDLSVDIASAFSDKDAGEVLTITVTGAGGKALPAWMVWDPATGMLTGTPVDADAGVTEVVATATDAAGAKVSDTFLVVVIKTVEAPVLHVSALRGTTPLTGGYAIWLYKQNGTSYDPVVTTPVFGAGTYTFYNLQPGSYLAKAEITDEVMNPGLLTTWYASSVTVAGAGLITVPATGTVSAEITMVAAPVATGEGIIRGMVVRKTGTPDLITQGNDPPASPAAGISMVLKQNGLVAGTTVTGADGKYAFTELPWGDYAVFAEVPGYTQEVTQAVTLSAAAPLREKVDFTIWTAEGSHIITSVSQRKQEFGLDLYPNPTTGMVTIRLSRTTSGKVDVAVFNLLGVQVFRNQFTAQDQIRFDLADRATGIYMVKIGVEGRTFLKKLTLVRR